MPNPWNIGFPQEALLEALQLATLGLTRNLSSGISDKLLVPDRVKELGALLGPKKEHEQLLRQPPGARRPPQLCIPPLRILQVSSSLLVFYKAIFKKKKKICQGPVR